MIKIEKPMELLFLDPTSPDGQEIVKLDMRITCKGHVISPHKSSRFSPARRREARESNVDQEPLYTLKCNSLTKSDIVSIVFMMPNTGK